MIDRGAAEKKINDFIDLYCGDFDVKWEWDGGGYDDENPLAFLELVDMEGAVWCVTISLAWDFELAIEAADDVWLSMNEAGLYRHLFWEAKDKITKKE